MADMIKFFKGLEASLPASGVNGALYITTDEGAIYLGTGTGMKRLGDFVQVDNVAALPEKAHESCLYYCVAENILAKWNGTEWKQINKQPTAEELKTLLGLGTLAYKSEVAEADLNADLAAKINASTEANHGHENKTVLDGITAEKVAAWDGAEAAAKAHADGLNTAMNTRVEALEAIDHEHANKALLDTYTQTEADLADAVAKKHAHTFNETELNKIAEGDVAKWNGVAADHLTADDKTALENLIKEAKKAGTDANTNIEAYKVTNDARVLAVEEDVAEITDGTNGILAQAKAYSDGKLATARTEITAEIDADVKVVADELAGYKTSNDAALAGVKATADAAAVKTEVESALAGKVAKTDYEADKATFATKTELNGVDAKFANYRTSADQDTIDNGHKERIEALEAKFTGDDSVDAKIAAAVAVETQARETAVAGVQGEVDAVEGRMDTAEGKITALETASATHALKTEVEAVDAKFANYKTAEAQKAIDDEQDRRLGVIEGDYLKAADIANFETKENVKKVADDLAAYVESNDAALAGVKATAEAAAVKTEVEAALALKADKSVVDAMYTNAQIDGFIAAEKQRAEGIEAGLRTDVDAIKGDYLKAEDKTELEGKITAEETRAKAAEEGLQTQINTIMNNPDTEGVINSINEFTQYIADHGEIAEGFRTDIDKNKADIAANAKAIADEITRATGAEEALGGRIDELKASYDEHTHSWNDLTDKPFEALDTIAWDGDTTGRETSGGNYKIAEYIEPEKFIGATVHFANGSTMQISAENIEYINDAFGVGFNIQGIIIGNESFVVGDEPLGVFVVSTLRTIEFPVKTLDDKFISANIARVADVNAANEALSGRIATLEAIDHDAYVAADTALKTELQGEIEAAKTDASNKDAVVLAEAQKYTDAAKAEAITDAEGKVNALANGQVATNANDIAALFEMLTWGEFPSEPMPE